MSDGWDKETIGALLACVWAMGGFVLIIGSIGLVEEYLFIWMVAVVEWLLIGFTAIAVLEPAQEFRQRPDETNARFVLRAWARMHALVLFRAPVKAVLGAPATIRRGIVWLRETPEEGDRA